MIFNENLNDTILKYQKLIYNYTKFFNANIYNCNSNINYYEKIYTHGLNIIQNIFNITSIYLYNISDINNICEKGYIYFIEFINQLSITNYNDNNIDLSLKDAILFSYKKTIFNLDKHNHNISIIEKKILDNLNSYIFLINNINIIINRNLYVINNNLINMNNDNIINNIDNVCNDNNIENLLLQNNNIINKIIKKINNILKFNSTLDRLNEINNIIQNILSNTFNEGVK